MLSKLKSGENNIEISAHIQGSSRISKEVRAYRGQIRAYLRQIRAYLRQIRTYLRQIHSYLRQIRTYLGQIRAFFGLNRSYTRQIHTYPKQNRIYPKQMLRFTDQSSNSSTNVRHIHEKSAHPPTKQQILPTFQHQHPI
jgi:DNA repair ATPase RecN